MKVSDPDTIFSLGDFIEYSNGGIVRTVISVNSDSIGIDPPLDYDKIGSLWGNYVIHWGSSDNIIEDYTPSGIVCSGSESGSYMGAVPCE